MFKLAEPVGNLLDEGFEAVWFKKRSKWIRDKEAALKSARIANICGMSGSLSLYFNIHGYEELYDSWKSFGLCKERSSV